MSTKSIYNIATVHDYNSLRGITTMHPLVTVIDFSDSTQFGTPKVIVEADTLHFECYAVFLKQGEKCKISYGRQPYDYQEGTLVFLAPGQTISIEPDAFKRIPAGFALLFHPDLLAKSALEEQMKQYKFFSYQTTEGLHISEKERSIVVDCFQKIAQEASSNIDEHSRKLIVSTLQLLLDYCQRFYGRQFHTRFRENSFILARFEDLLLHYFESGRAEMLGLPTVSYFASELHLSPNYFGDLIAKQVGKSPKDIIQDKIISAAKLRLRQPGALVSQVAYGLGFKHAQHLTRLFKQRVGIPPTIYQLENR